MTVQFVGNQVTNHSVAFIFHVHHTLLRDRRRQRVAVVLAGWASRMEHLLGLPSVFRGIVARNFNFMPASPTGHHDSIHWLSVNFNQ